MSFITNLLILKQKIDKELVLQFDKSILDIRKKDVFLAEALLHAKKITLSGGKRLRPALFFCSAKAVGEKNEKKIIKVAVAIELVHAFLLIHDDIIDEGDFRHGVSTINKEYEKIAKKKFKNKNCTNFGNSMAVILGDLVFSMAMEIILKAGLEKEKMQNIMVYLQKVIQNTIIGQSQDMLIECQKKVSKEEILAMYENKTAKYSFEGPLLMGLMMSLKSHEKIKKAFSDFSIPLGIAFQMQDDIIGIFGQKKETGKSIITDIEQGKKTILVLETIEKLEKNNRKKFEDILQKRSVTKEDAIYFKKMIKESGALEFVEKDVEKNLSQSKKALDKIDIDKKSKEFLIGLIDYLRQRRY